MAFPNKEMINLNVSFGWYLLWGIGLSLIVRLILCFWRAWMPKTAVGEEREEGVKEEDKEWYGTNYCKRWLISLKGFGEPFRIDVRNEGDYWLPYLVGVAELLAYPILFRFDQVGVIGGWIALKTVGNWGVWRKRRNSFYNFLWGNILTIGFSYFLMIRFIDP